MALTLADALRQTGYAKDGQLQAPAPTQPNLSTMAADYLRQLPEKTAQNAINTNKMVQGVFPTDPFGKPNPDYYPEAMSEFANFVPNLMGATAFHGTPHKIKGLFDISKVGTGEGAQAYGHGMYFAENPAVATQYKNLLSKPEFTKNAQGVELRGQLPRMLDESYSELIAKNGIQQTNYGDVTDIVGQRLDRQMKDALKANDMDWYNKVADMKMDLARFKENPPPNVGNLYKVDIPDADIPKMIDFEIPFKEQPKDIQEWFIKVNPENSQMSTNVAFTRYLINPDTSKQAAEQLANLGYKGIRYLDEGSRSTKAGTTNFVVFDPSKVKILEENGIPTRKELIQQQIDKIE
jgi:hypothetical protein